MPRSVLEAEIVSRTGHSQRVDQADASLAVTISSA
jgi:hypothetical protein